MPRIFISYRRADSMTISGRIYDRLASAYRKRNVFKDVDNIGAGADFRGRIVAAVAACDMVLVVIGRQWLDIKDESGNRRLDDPNDFVRIEVETVLTLDNALVIPVMVDHAEMPEADHLPVALRQLAFRNAVVIRDDPDFHRDVDRLIRQIGRPWWQKVAVVAALIAVLLIASLFLIRSLAQTDPQAEARRIYGLTAAVQAILDGFDTATHSAETAIAAAFTPTPSHTAKPSPTPTDTPTPTSSPTPTFNPTPTLNLTATAEAKLLRGAQNTLAARQATAAQGTINAQETAKVPTNTPPPTATPTWTPSNTPTPTFTVTPTPTPTTTLTPSFTPTPTIDAAATANAQATQTAAAIQALRNAQATVSARTTQTQRAARPTATLTPTPVPTATPLPMGVVPAGQQTVNVRSGSSTNNAVVATLTVGDAVTILGDTGEGGWLQVQLKDGTKGWVKAGLLVTSVKRNADWKPITRSFDGVEMVLVPPGCFLMGSSDGNTNERPMNLQCFNKPFWIDKTEVTNGQFTQFKGQAANKGQWSQPNRPRETITWFEARDFCAKRGSRLPTEREWEFAARGPNNLKFPWGDDFSYDNAVWAFNSNEQTMAVGSRPKGASWVGALDMSGNVWEWINTIYDQRRFPYPYESDDGRESFTGTSSERTGDAW